MVISHDWCGCGVQEQTRFGDMSVFHRLSYSYLVILTWWASQLLITHYYEGKLHLIDVPCIIISRVLGETYKVIWIR